jgi:hypothetical protein
LQEAGITFIGGLSGNGKTFIMLAMAKALLECEALFGYFAVPRPSERVVYLIPECTLSSLKKRIQIFHLETHIRSGRLLVRTLSSKEEISLTDSRLLRAVEGADLFLDTAVRFMEGGEDVESARKFAREIFGLLSVGARTITGAHHSPKGFSKEDYMTLENIFRGTGDFGAILASGWGVRQIDAQKNRIFVQNVKPRDFTPCEPFIIEGRPHLDRTGHFALTEPPGFAGELKSHINNGKPGAPTNPDRDDLQRRAVEMKARGMSVRAIAKELNTPRTTLERWLGDSSDPKLYQ